MRWAYLFTLNWRLHWRSPQIPFRIAFLALLLGFILASLSLGDRLSQGIATHGKAWLGADVALQFRGELSATAWARAQQYAQSEALTLTPVSECFVTTSTSLSQPQTALLKAVDPSAYPLLGQLRLLPPLPLRTALLVGQVAVGADPLGQFNFQPGLAIQIAGQRFQAAANLESEPDALAGTASFALRILISRQDFTALRPHLDSPYCLERLLFRVPNAAQLNHHVEALSTLFPDAEVVDHRLPVSQGRMLLSATQRALQLSSYAAAAALFALLCSLLLLTQNRETLSFLAGLGARPDRKSVV